MGLRNKSEKPVTLKYNGKEVVLQPGDTIDVRDFNIMNHQVHSVEETLIEKNLGADGRTPAIERVKTLSNMSDKEITSEIAQLTEEKNELSAHLKKSEEELAQATVEINTVKDQLNTANARIKELEQEIEEIGKKKK